MKFATIEEFYEAVKSGKIDESKLEIVLDNDCTDFYIGALNDNEIHGEEANGHYDVERLYRLLFPKAKVEWV